MENSLEDTKEWCGQIFNKTVLDIISFYTKSKYFYEMVFKPFLEREHWSLSSIHLIYINKKLNLWNEIDNTFKQITYFLISTVIRIQSFFFYQIFQWKNVSVSILRPWDNENE